MAFFSWSTMKSLYFILVSILPKQSSRSQTVESELALNSSPSSGGGASEESSAAVAAAGSSESTAEDNPSTSLGAALAAASSSESTPEDNPPTSLGELAIPAILSVGIYGSIPPAVHVDHRNAPLYEPLVAFICLAVFTSLSDIICVLLRRPGARGVALLMGSSIVFLLVAFFLRILLLPP